MVKGHVRLVSVHCWQALFRLNKQTWTNRPICGLGLRLENRMYELQHGERGAPQLLLIPHDSLIKQIVSLHVLCVYIWIQIDCASYRSFLPLILNRTLFFIPGIHLSLINSFHWLQCEPSFFSPVSYITQTSFRWLFFLGWKIVWSN